jgi:hypothetical protein
MAKELHTFTSNEGDSYKDPLSLGNNCTIEIPLKDDPSGEPEAGCFSSFKQFRYRTWQYMVILKYILCC